MDRTAPKGNILILALVGAFFLALLSVGAVLYFKTTPNTTKIFPQTMKSTPVSNVDNLNLKNYTSKDLKISFQYPKDWYLDDRYLMILLTNYETNLNRDDTPVNNQVEILISNFKGCHDTIEENLMDPACGEGGPSVPKNKILSKETRQTKGGTFYKYIVESPNKNFTYYLFEKGDKVLQIEKLPDPSKFEKEFEEIVSAIKFL